MCGRFAVVEPLPDLLSLLGVAGHHVSEKAYALPIRYNVSPMSFVLTVTRAPDGGRAADALRWGLVPWFSRDPSAGARMINARRETAWEKPSYRESMAMRRCLIPVTGFYEWKRASPGAGNFQRPQPYFFRLTEGHPMALGGIWASWRPQAESPDLAREGGADAVAPDGGAGRRDPLRTFAILTTQANDLVGTLHERMPVIIPASAWEAWLSPNTPTETVNHLCDPSDPRTLEGYPVTDAVNRSGFEDPRAVVPIGEPLRLRKA